MGSSTLALRGDVLPILELRSDLVMDDGGGVLPKKKNYEPPPHSSQFRTPNKFG